VRHQDERHRPFRAFDHPGFRLLFIATALGDAGFWISYISLQWVMARRTDASPGWLGLLFFCNFIPMLVFAPVAGVVADRVDRRGVLIASRVVLALLSSALAVISAAGVSHPAVVLSFGASFGAIFAFMAPAGQAVLANAVPRDDLTSAVSIQSAGTNLTRVAGPAIAAPILAASGAGASFALYAVVNVVMALALRRVPLPPLKPAANDVALLGQIREGVIHARERWPAGLALVAMAVFSVFGSSHASMYPVIARKVLNRGGSAFTALVSMSGAGAVLGTLLITLRRRAPTLGTAAMQLMGFSLALIAFSLSRSWGASVAIAAAIGFFSFGFATELNIVLQHAVDEDKRGRVMSLYTLTWAGLVPFGGLVLGGLAGSIGAPRAIGLGAVVCLTAGLLLAARGAVARNALHRRA
jgi:MFS family permease